MGVTLRRALTRGGALVSRQRPAPTILMYHRVAEIAVDPWRLAVPPRHFARQMAVIRRRRSPMPLDELFALARRGRAPADAVAVTFDDGYADVLVNAKPVLVRHGVPATLFLPTGSIGQAEEFWWDELAKLILARPRSASGVLDLGDRRVRFSLPGPAHAPWRRTKALEARGRTHLGLWKALRAAPPILVRHAMAQLRSQLGSAPRAPLDRVMDAAEIGLWLEGGLTAIAGHSVTHRPLTMVPPEERMAEIAESMAVCARLSGRFVPGFCYPHGDRDDAVAEAVRRAGAEWACSTREAALGRPNLLDPFDLPRLQVLPGRLNRQWVRP